MRTAVGRSILSFQVLGHHGSNFDGSRPAARSLPETQGLHARAIIAALLGYA